MRIWPWAFGLWLVSLMLSGCVSLPHSSESKCKACNRERIDDVSSFLAIPFETPRRASGPSRGTAIPLGNGRILTSRHLLPEDAFGITVEVAGEALTSLPTLHAELGGVPVEYRVLHSGTRTDRIEEDWAILEVGGGPKLRDPRALGITFDPEHVLKNGQRAFLIGFDRPPEEEGPQVLCAKVHDPPLGIVVSPRVVCVSTHSTQTHQGVSGGPLVVQDGDTLVVVGIYRGMRILEMAPFTISSVHVVCRLPMEVR